MNIKILQIVSEVNVGSVGKIAEEIGHEIIEFGWDSHICYGREIRNSKSSLYRIGTKLDVLNHVLYTRISDRHGFGSKNATDALIRHIESISPDIIHLHHLHGYYINIKVLFNYLASQKIPIVWTFHDCWAFTGHCAYYDLVDCQKWKTECGQCPQIGSYPKSWFLDRSKKNYYDKKQLFTSLSNLTIVPVSDWLNSEVKKSFLNNISTMVIKNGIDTDVFKPRGSIVRNVLNLKDKFVILGVAHVWSERKGLDDFINLAKILDSSYAIVLIGLTKKQIASLPIEIIGIERTTNAVELSEYYSMADVFLNLTLEEALGLTNMESIACGTPVITYDSGGAAESVTKEVGCVVRKGDLYAIKNILASLRGKRLQDMQDKCVDFAKNKFDSKQNLKEYIKLYQSLLL